MVLKTLAYIILFATFIVACPVVFILSVWRMAINCDGGLKRWVGEEVERPIHNLWR